MKQNRTVSCSSPFELRFREQLKSHRFMFTALIIINLLGMPLALISWITMSRAFSHPVINEFGSVNYVDPAKQILYAAGFGGGLIFSAASVFSGIVAAVKIFGHLLNKQKADMVFSLPCDRKTLFKADFLAGLTVYMIPALTASLITAAYVVIIKLTDPELLAYYTERYEYSAPVTETAFMIVSALVGMIMFYCLAVLCTVSSSSAGKTVFSILLVNAVLFGAVRLCGTAVTADLKGVTCGEYYIYAFLSPLSLISVCQHYCLMLHPMVPLAVNLILSALASVYAYRIYQRKSPESISASSGEPGVYCLTVFSSAVFLLLVLKTFLPLASALAVVAIVFCLSEYIRRKMHGRKSFSTVSPAVSVVIASALALGLPFISRETGGFGIQNFIPDTKNIEHIELYGDFPGWPGYKTNLQDGEVNELVTELNSMLIASSVSETKMSSYSYTLKYLLKNGSYICREYYIPDEKKDDRVYQILSKAAEISSCDYMKDYVCSEIREDLTKRISLHFAYVTEDENPTYLIPVNEMDIDEFADILTDEVMSLTTDDLINSGSSPWVETSTGYIPACYENTLKYIEEVLCKEQYRDDYIQH